MTQEYPDDLKYLDTHEYVRLEGDVATIGISAFALDQLGDIVFLELPEIDDALELDANFGTIESVKAVEDLYPPIAGTVIDRNEAVLENPEAIAEDPYGEGWLIKIRVDNLEELGNLLSASDYQAMVEGED